MAEYTLIFDIGKTNKKYFVFDESLKTIEEESFRVDEIVDDDGAACDNITEIKRWMLETFLSIKKKYSTTLKFVNISAYGASFIHLDKNLELVTPLYNYMKEVDESIFDPLYQSNGGVKEMSRITASPKLAMLNSGFQLYWLKAQKPDLFNRIVSSLHLPNYLSFLFHNTLLTDYTSVGCHTGMWNFEKSAYHEWIQKEGIADQLPKIVNSTSCFSSDDGICVGTGLHDSSAALVPYLRFLKDEFIVLSTGTWSIAMNPFNDEPLSEEQLENDCLTYLRVDGLPVMASRLFLGREHEVQVKRLTDYFGVDKEYYRTLKMNPSIFSKIEGTTLKCFSFSYMGEVGESRDLSAFSSFNEAYHQLVLELVQRQMKSINLVLSKMDKTKSLIIDGGFAQSDLYCKMLKAFYPHYKVFKSDLKSGAALGAAMCVNGAEGGVILEQV